MVGQLQVRRGLGPRFSHQPVARHPSRIRAARVLPLPAHTLQRPKPQFNPHPQARSTHPDRVGR